MSFVSRNHPQQVGARGALDRVDDRRTPDKLWLPLHEQHRFTLDVAASSANTRVPDNYYSVERSGLEHSWGNQRVWCNPPYSDIRPWVEKAWQAWWDEWPVVIVMLLPANRTEQLWWQDLVEPYRDNVPRRDSAAGVLTTRFLPGRLRFDVPDGTYSDPRGNRPPFGCVLLTWAAA